jgi:outer membrane lipoprotein-sorting protein
MTRPLKFLLLALIFARAAAPAFCEKTVEEIVDEANKLLRGQSSHSRISMKIETPKWERTLEIEAWNHGRNRALMRIHAPAKERGNGTLKVDKELWNWLPNVERVIKIPPSMMHSSWMGSDFTYEDVVKADSIVKDYTHRVVEKKPAGEFTRYVIESTPKPDAPVVWGRIVSTVDLDAQGVVPRTEEDYSERGDKMRTLSFLDVKNMGGKRLPTRVECLPHKKEGHKTTITYQRLDFDLDFAPDFFGLRTLQKPLP